MHAIDAWLRHLAFPFCCGMGTDSRAEHKVPILRGDSAQGHVDSPLRRPFSRSGLDPIRRTALDTTVEGDDHAAQTVARRVHIRLPMEVRKMSHGGVR